MAETKVFARKFKLLRRAKALGYRGNRRVFMVVRAFSAMRVK